MWYVSLLLWPKAAAEKAEQLAKRFEKREEAKEEGEEAKEVGTAEDMDRFSRRTVKVTKEHNEECRRLLKLMGIPVVVVSFSPVDYKLYLMKLHRLLQKLRRNVPSLHEEERFVNYFHPCCTLLMTLSVAGLRSRFRRHGHPHLLNSHPLPTSHLFRSKEATHQ